MFLPCQCTSYLRQIVLGSACAAVLFGQASTGIVVVNVQDPSGAAIVGATVTITERATGLSTSRESGVNGIVRFVSVKPSVYGVSVTSPGFKTYEQRDVRVNVAESVSLTAGLELGDVSEVIEVSGSAPLLQTERGELGQVIGEEQVVDLPLNGRNPIALAALTPGVTPGANFGNNPLLIANLNVSGGRGGATEILQDGAPSTVPENSPGTYATATLPSVERVQEFKVQTNAFSAEYGRTAGGVINVVVKSGTNEFHGSVYEFLRNSVLDANNFFLNRAGRELGTFQRNQFGFTFGGPIVKNRTFFFGGYEGLRERSLQTSQSTIPTDLELAGNFSNTLNRQGAPITVYDPLTTGPDSDGEGSIRMPFPGNVIPDERIDPVASRAFSFYPTPNLPGDGPAKLNNFIASGSFAQNDDNFDGRIDHQITPKQTMYLRASYRNYGDERPNFYGTPGQPSPQSIPRPGHSGSLRHNYTMKPNLLSEFTYGYARLFTLRSSFSFGRDISQDLGLPNDLAAISDGAGFPAYSIPGYGNIGQSFLARFSLETHSIQEHLTYLSGKHSIKFGMQVRVSRTNFFQGNAPAGQFNISSAFTQGPDPTRGSATAGHPVATMLIGSAASGFVSHDAHVSTQSPHYSWFVQDDIKVNPALTLNFGLRYSLEIPRSERYNRLSVFNPLAPSPIAPFVEGYEDLTGGLEFLGINREHQFSTDKANFGPRFGFAWRSPWKIVLRGGYGLFYPPSSKTAAGTLGGGGNAGFASQTPFVQSIDGGLTPFNRLSDPFPSGFSLPPGSSLGLNSFLGLDFQTNSLFDRSPYVQQWNLNIQREIVPNLLLEAGYSGSKGNRLSLVFGSPNQLSPEALRLGDQLLQQVDNPFFGFITDPASPLSLPTVARNQLERPYPQFGNISLEKATIANSIYHAFHVRVDRRFAKGVSFLLSYTAAKAIDDGSTSGTGLLPPYAYIQNWRNRQAERSLSVFDVSQRLVISPIVEIPVGRGRRFGADMSRVADLIVGGWQVNGILTFSTGFPLIIANAVNNSSSLNNIGLGGTGTQRPNNNGRSPAKSGPVVDRLNEYFDTSVFSQPEPFTFGNSPRTMPDVRQPGVRNLDLSLFKNFTVTEDIRVQFRAEAFNLTNTPQFGGPGASFGAGNFGVISSQSNAPRQIQLGLRVTF